jgi:hypothetical protein
MHPDDIESALKGRKVSRRWLMRSAVNLTAGAVTASTVSFAAADSAAAATATGPDHDPVTGEIFDRDRHHHWDTV